MQTIERSIEIDSSRDKVWEIISDLDNEAEYWWGTKEVHNFSKDGNIINREIVQNFRNHKISQKVIITPKNLIEIQYLKGLTMGSKILKLESIDENKQKLTTTWNVHFSGIYKLLNSYLYSHILKGTIGAHQRIKDAAEGRAIVPDDKA